MLHNSLFGSSLDASGEWLLVGDYGAGSSGGEAYLYRHTETGWRWEQTFKGDAGSVFGLSTAIHGDTLAVGDPGWGSPRKSLGRVYVYSRRGKAWLRSQVIEASGLARFVAPRFGNSVDICNDVMVVGARNTDTFVEHAGLIRIYERDGVQWELEAEFRLRPTPRAVQGRAGSLGRAVAVDGYTVVAAAPRTRGDVYVFEKAGGAWQFSGELSNPSERAGDYFGGSLDIANGVVVVGATGEYNSFGLQGLAHVYEKKHGEWQFSSTLQASDGFGGGGVGDFFGWSVSVSGTNILVGAPLGNYNGDHTGTAYLFKNTPSGWTRLEHERLVASDSHHVSEALGSSVRLLGDVALVGARNGFVRENRVGKVYVFDLP